MRFDKAQIATNDIMTTRWKSEPMWFSFGTAMQLDKLTFCETMKACSNIVLDVYTRRATICSFIYVIVGETSFEK